jgi:hypothetical protein
MALVFVLGIGQTAVGVDGGVDVGVADAGPGLGGVLVLNALDPPATTFRYSGLLFDVDMDQLAGVSGALRCTVSPPGFVGV